MMEEEQNLDSGYSVDDFESATELRSGISAKNKESLHLGEKSIDSYSNDFGEFDGEGSPLKLGSSQLQQKSVASDYSNDFSSPLTKTIEGSKSKHDSQLSTEGYEDDFLQEKSSLLLDPSKEDVKRENSVDYGDDFVEANSPERSLVKTEDKLAAAELNDYQEDFLSDSLTTLGNVGHPPLDPHLIVNPPVSRNQEDDPESSQFFETTADSSIFPHLPPSVQPVTSQKSSSSLLQTLEFQEKQAEVLTILPDDHSSTSNQASEEKEASIISQTNQKSGTQPIAHSLEYGSLEEKQLLEQLVLNEEDDPSLYILDDDDEEQQKKEEAKETEILAGYSEFLRRNSSFPELYHSNSDSNTLKATMATVSAPSIQEEEVEQQQEREEEENTSVLHAQVPKEGIKRAETPETMSLKENLTVEGQERVRRLSTNFMKGIFSATLPKEFITSMEEKLSNNQEESRKMEREEKDTTDTLLSPPLQTIAIPSAGKEQGENDNQRSIVKEEEEEDDEEVKYQSYEQQEVEEEEEEEEMFYYPPEPSETHLSPLNPSIKNNTNSTTKATNQLQPKKKKKQQHEDPLLAGLERYASPSTTIKTAATARSNGQTRPSSSSVKHNTGRPAPSSKPRPASSSGSQSVNQLRTAVAMNRKASVRDILAASTTPVARTKPPKQSFEELAAERMKAFVLSKPNNPVRYNVQENQIILTEVCLHRKPFPQCSNFFCQEAFKKYQWIKLIRKKSNLALDLLENAHNLWTKKLDQSLQEAVEALQSEQEQEVIIIAKKLSLATINDQKLMKTLKVMKRHDLDKDEHMTLLYEDKEYTFDHYTFLARQLSLRKDFNHHRKKAILDHLRYEHLKQSDELKESIRVPMVYLEKMRKDIQSVIHFHLQRVEKLLLYILKLCLQPKLLSPLSQSEKTLLENRIFKASLQAFDFLKVGLLTISMVCSKIREIYCNPDEEIMRSFLLNYRNPVQKETVEMGQSPPQDEKEEEEEERRRGRNNRPNSPPKTTSRWKQNKFSRYYCGEEEGGGEGLRGSIRRRRSRGNSPNNILGSFSPSRRPNTAPDQLEGRGRKNPDAGEAMRAFSPQQITSPDRDFQTLPISQNPSYYSDFDEAPPPPLEGEEEEERKRQDSISKPRSASSVEEEEIQTLREENSAVYTDFGEEDTKQLPLPQQQSAYSDRFDSLETDHPSNSSLMRKTSDDSPLRPTQKKAAKQSNSQSRSASAGSGTRQRRGSGRGRGRGGMIITKKDLLIAQMKETKRNTSLLLQEILQEHHLPVEEDRPFGRSNQKKQSTPAGGRGGVEAGEAKEPMSNQASEGLNLEIEQPEKTQHHHHRSSHSRQKKVECSFCHLLIPVQAAKRLPTAVAGNDEAVVDRAQQFLDTGKNLYRNLEKIQIRSLPREEYLILSQRLMRQLQTSVRKSSKRYSFVKNQSDGHLSGFNSTTNSFSGSLGGGGSSNDSYDGGGDVGLSPQRYKAHRPAPHHDAIFCSYECMKRWTIYYCPVQFRYESEMLINMVAGYEVKV